MKYITAALLFYNAVLTISIISFGLGTQKYSLLAPAILLIPVSLYFTYALADHLTHFTQLVRNSFLNNLSRALSIYSFTISWLLIISILASSQSIPQASLTLIFMPLGLHFFLAIANRRVRLQFRIRKTLSFFSLIRKTQSVASEPAEEEILDTSSFKRKKGKNKRDLSVIDADIPELQPIMDEEGESLPFEDAKRRQFLKILGGGGISLVFMLFFMPQKASAAFFGSTPGPGIIGLKDSAGNKIDPAEKAPTDGYNISQIDDAALPSYYGFVHKSGAWYISKEDNTGAYRYAAGLTNFSTNWINRASLTYNYFDLVF